jgi:oligosaccharyltransferase complex subunit delta (ribophorin II)
LTAKQHNSKSAATMRFSKSLFSAILLLAAGAAEAASSWSFDDATVAVSKKAGDGLKEK